MQSQTYKEKQTIVFNDKFIGLMHLPYNQKGKTSG
jgi:hypothetical protein